MKHKTENDRLMLKKQLEERDIIIDKLRKQLTDLMSLNVNASDLRSEELVELRTKEQIKLTARKDEVNLENEEQTRLIVQ